MATVFADFLTITSVQHVCCFLRKPLVEEFGWTHWTVHSLYIAVCAEPVAEETGPGVGSS